VPDARIFRYGYKSEWFGPDAIKHSARTVAERLLAALKRYRDREVQEETFSRICAKTGHLGADTGKGLPRSTLDIHRDRLRGARSAEGQWTYL